MASLECDRETIDGVTLVTCRLVSDVPERVTVEPTHEGPIWPPRRQGVPAAGWADGTWTGVVDADRPTGLGYATPTDPTGAPVRIANVEPARAPDDAPTARDVVRSLGDPSPTRDAVPTADGGDVRADDDAHTDRRTDVDGRTALDGRTDVEAPARADQHARADRRARPDEPDRTEEPGQTGRAGGTDHAGGIDHPGGADRAGGSGQAAGPAWPREPDSADRVGPVTGTTATATDRAGVAFRLDAIETRLETAEELAAVSTPEEARAVVADAGGLDAVRSLVAHLEADRAFLASLRERADELATQAADTEVPIDALERLV